MREDRTVNLRSAATTGLEVCAAGSGLAAGWLLAGLGGLLAVVTVLLVIISWLLERRR